MSTVHRVKTVFDRSKANEQQRRVREEIAPEPMLSREERGARRAAAQAAAQIAAVMKASEMDVDM